MDSFDGTKGKTLGRDVIYDCTEKTNVQEREQYMRGAASAECKIYVCIGKINLSRIPYKDSTVLASWYNEKTLPLPPWEFIV